MAKYYMIFKNNISVSIISKIICLLGLISIIYIVFLSTLKIKIIDANLPWVMEFKKDLDVLNYPYIKETTFSINDGKHRNDDVVVFPSIMDNNMVILMTPPDSIFLIKNDFGIYGEESITVNRSDIFKIIKASQYFEEQSNGDVVEVISYKTGGKSVIRKTLRDANNYQFTFDPYLSRYKYAISFDGFLRKILIMDSKGEVIYKYGYPDLKPHEEYDFVII